MDLAWVEFAVSLDRFALAALQVHPNDDLKIHGLHNRDYKALIKSGWLPETLEGRQKKLETIAENERTHLLRDICAGRLWAIGFQALSGLVEPLRVPRELFDEAEHPEHRRSIDWSKSAINVDTGSFLNIHVTRPPLGGEDSSPAPTPGATANPSDVASPAVTQPRNAPGRPSVATDVLAAIAHHAKTDPHLKRPRHERHQNYRSYLASQTKDPQRYKNISEKTLEKYEREFLGKSSSTVPIKGL